MDTQPAPPIYRSQIPARIDHVSGRVVRAVEGTALADTPHIPIFPRVGNRMVAINPALVRAVESQTSGGVKVIFDREHEIMVDASLYDVMKALWDPAPIAEIKGIPLKSDP